MMYLIANVALVFFLIVMLKPSKITIPYGKKNILVDSYGKKYDLDFYTTFGAGKNVDHCLHVNDWNREKEFQEYYTDSPLFEIHRGTDAFYLRKKDPDIDIILHTGERKISLTDEQEQLIVGAKFDVHLDMGCDFAFEFCS